MTDEKRNMTIDQCVRTELQTYIFAAIESELPKNPLFFATEFFVRGQEAFVEVIYI